MRFNQCSLFLSIINITLRSEAAIAVYVLIYWIIIAYYHSGGILRSYSLVSGRQGANNILQGPFCGSGRLLRWNTIISTIIVISTIMQVSRKTSNSLYQDYNPRTCRELHCRCHSPAKIRGLQLDPQPSDCHYLGQSACSNTRFCLYMHARCSDS